jgi:uncharacterized cupin superfamily protein
MPKVNLDAIEAANTTGYPAEHAGAVAGRWSRRIGVATGMAALGANHCTLKPGAWSSHRHWHDSEDELLVMLTGEAVLVEDDGRSVLRPGDICAWPAGSTNGHHLRNESDADCSFVVVSAGERTTGGYSDIDMTFTADGRYLHRDGREYVD